MSKKLNVKGADPRLESLFDYFVSRWPGEVKSRDIWTDRIRKAASQPGFEFEPALRRFLVYVLVGSKKYSVLTSLKATHYPKKRDIEKIIVRVAGLIKKGASKQELKAASWPARRASYAARSVGGRREGGDAAAYAALATLASASYFNTVFTDHAANATAEATRAAFWADPVDDSEEPIESARQEFAAALLYFVEQEAYGRGKRRGNPASEKVPSLERLLGTRKTSRNAAPRSANPKTAKKTAKRKTPPPLPEKMRKRSMTKAHRTAVSNPGILIDNPRRLAPPPAMSGYSREAFEAASPRAFELLTRALMERKQRAMPGKKRPVTKQRNFLRKVENRNTGTANLIAAKALDDEGYSDNTAELAIASKLRSFARMLLKKTPTEFRNFVDGSKRIRSAVAPDVRRMPPTGRGSRVTAKPTGSKSRGGPKGYGDPYQEAGALGVERGVARTVDPDDPFAGYGEIAEVIAKGRAYGDQENIARAAKKYLAGRRRNPSKKKAKKKTAKRKAPLAKTLISKCQKAWDHYCERPSKKRLKEVFDHLEVMKESSAKTVKDERARCLRAANKEAKRLGMKR